MPIPVMCARASVDTTCSTLQPPRPSPFPRTVANVAHWATNGDHPMPIFSRETLQTNKLPWIDIDDSSSSCSATYGCRVGR